MYIYKKIGDKHTFTTYINTYKQHILTNNYKTRKTR